MTILLLSILAVIVIFLIVAALQSNDYVISREVTVHQPREKVFDYLRHIRHMEQYNKWVMTDPNQKTDFRGTDGKTGFVYAWDSNNKQAGKGEQEIKQLVLNEKIALEIRFEKPFQGVSEAMLMTSEEGPGKTRVTYVFKGAKNFGMKIAHLLFNLENVLGKDLDISLKNLKARLET